MRRTWISILLCATLAGQQPADTPLFKASANLVIVTVFVKDKDGKPLRGLNKDDFQVYENSKQQPVSVFEFEELSAPPAAAKGTALLTPEEHDLNVKSTTPQGSVRYQNRRLLVLFFDWSSLPTADQVRAKAAAEKYVTEKMTPADLVSLVSFGTKLKVDQEFTDDRDQLISVIRRYHTGESSELASDANTTEDTSDDSAYAADETEFNIFNTDRKLGALEDLARKFSALPEKKAVVYFSSGVSRTGTENESQLRATVNAAVRSNVSFYPVDVRGLTATPVGGDASTASGGTGTGMYSGQSQGNQRQQFLDSQDTLRSLAADTGGKPALDTNDLGVGIQLAQQEVQSYYILGYYSSDDRRDGQFRRVEVKLTPQTLARTHAKLDYRNGYFAEKEFKAFNSADKEKQLEDALLLGDPATDLPLAVEVNWFRMGKDKYFVPVALKIPGSEVPLKKAGSAETTTFDFIGQVRNSKGATVGTVRDSIKIQLRDHNAGQLASRHLIYDTGFTLVPGRYSVKMLARENQTGKMGTFEASFVVPDLDDVKDSARLSSVVWSAQKAPVSDAIGLADKNLKKQATHPLVQGQQKLLPSVTRVFHNGQTLYAYAEIYDPTMPETFNKPFVAAEVGLYGGNKLVAESRPVMINALKEGRSKTAPIMVELPLKDLAPGEYVAQLSVFDQAGQKFTFSRSPVVVLSPAK
jgi:VWFA-related protein